MEEKQVFNNPEQFSLCQRVRERLPDLLEGYLDALAAEAVFAHLAACYLCAREYRELQQTIKMVETLPFVEPGRDFAPAIMAALQTQSGSFFPSPVVETKIQKSLRVFRPQTTTGAPRPLFTWSMPALCAAA